MTPYEDLFKRFNMATQCYDLDSIPEDDRDAFLIQLMNNAIDTSILSNSGVDLSRDDTAKQFSSNIDTFVLQIIAEYMVHVWTGRYLYDQDLLQQYGSSSAIKVFSPASHIKTLQEVNTKSQLKAENLYKQYSVGNSLSKLS